MNLPTSAPSSSRRCVLPSPFGDCAWITGYAEVITVGAKSDNRIYSESKLSKVSSE
jgi:hypothetical protein